jgi:hypothetical protein
MYVQCRFLPKISRMLVANATRHMQLLFNTPGMTLGRVSYNIFCLTTLESVFFSKFKVHKCTQAIYPRIKQSNHSSLLFSFMDVCSLDCHVVGRYNADNDDLSYSMLDSRDPTKGVSISYPSGEKCSSGALRTTTLGWLSSSPPLSSSPV